jgi:hypothetical protein
VHGDLEMQSRIPAPAGAWMSGTDLRRAAHELHSANDDDFL